MFIASSTKLSPEEVEKLENEKFQIYYQTDLAQSASSYKSIPKFYHKLPKVNDTLAKKLREEARASFLQIKNRELLNAAELKHMWSLLDKGEVFSSREDEFLNYAEFKSIGEKAGPKYKYTYIYKYYVNFLF